MKRMIRLCSNYYSKNDLEFLIALLDNYKIDKMTEGSHSFYYLGSTFNIWVDSDGNIILLNIAHDRKD